VEKTHFKHIVLHSINHAQSLHASQYQPLY